jgi:hypothetical protein
MKTIHTHYHSRDWDHLVEQGWITAYVIENPSDGCRIAVMVRP